MLSRLKYSLLGFERLLPELECLLSALKRLLVALERLLLGLQHFLLFIKPAEPAIDLRRGKVRLFDGLLGRTEGLCTTGRSK